MYVKGQGATKNQATAKTYFGKAYKCNNQKSCEIYYKLSKSDDEPHLLLIKPYLQIDTRVRHRL